MTRPAPKTRPRRAPPRFGLTLAGGGALDAICEIGALGALEEALTGIDFTEYHGSIGVSASRFIAAGPPAPAVRRAGPPQRLQATQAQAGAR